MGPDINTTIYLGDFGCNVGKNNPNPCFLKSSDKQNSANLNVKLRGRF